MHHRSHDEHPGGIGFLAYITGHMTRGVCIQEEEGGLHPGEVGIAYRGRSASRGVGQTPSPG